MAADAVLDSAGVALAVNDTVNLVGTVTAINLLDNRFNDIEVTLSHPTTVAPRPTASINLTKDAAEVRGFKKIRVNAAALTKA